MKDLIKQFKVTNGSDFLLKDFDPAYTGDLKKEDSEQILEDLIKATSLLQSKLYADNSYAVLILFQAMDAAGKDGAIAHTLSGLNPQGCEVYSFKAPSSEELEHDFLWRHFKVLPRSGHIGVHNRSHYENVLITRVHPEMLLSEHLPGINSLNDIDKNFWNNRYESIRNVEKHLVNNGTIFIKFFLNLSKEKQKERFLERIDDPEKNWKFSAADINERAYWDEYMLAYENAIQETATTQCPWYVLPADKKWFTRIAISTIILETLKGLNLKYPQLPAMEKEKLDQAKEKLKNDV